MAEGAASSVRGADIVAGPLTQGFRDLEVWSLKLVKSGMRCRHPSRQFGHGHVRCGWF